MKEHDFTLILTADPIDEDADKLYGIFNDGTIATRGGVSQIHFHREAVCLEDALRSAISDVRTVGFDALGPRQSRAKFARSVHAEPSRATRCLNLL